MAKLLRYRGESTAEVGVLEGDSVYSIDGNVFGTFSPGRFIGRLEDIKVLPPCEPSKIISVGLNYRDHAMAVGAPLPEEPILCLKAPTTLIGHGDAIVWPEGTERIDFEAELAIVIGRITRNISPVNALDQVLGYTCANDITARDIQRRDGQWTRAKSFDTFCPLGPCIATGIDPGDLPVTARLNGEVRQSSTTANLIFGVPYLISFISRVMTLLPGDVILTGTPAGIGPMKPGDVVEVEIGSVGLLRNTLVRNQL